MWWLPLAFVSTQNLLKKSNAKKDRNMQQCSFYKFDTEMALALIKRYLLDTEGGMADDEQEALSL